MGGSATKHKQKNSCHSSITKPSCPGKPTLVNESHSDPHIIQIQWDPPEHDVGCKLLGYLVEHKRTCSPHWVRATPLKVKQNQLILSGLEPGWRYQFRVFAENSIGLSEASPISEPLTICVNRPASIAPCFSMELTAIEAVENDKVEFYVEFSGIPNPKILWFKDNVELMNNRCVRIQTEDNYSALVFYQVSLRDEGEIKCSATNRAGHTVTKAYLAVYATPSVEFPKHYEAGLLYEKGDCMRLKATVEGKPIPSLIWYHDKEVLSMSERCSFLHEANCCILKIDEMQRSDRGEYQLHAVNMIGIAIASVLVTVADKPDSPQDVRATITSESSVSLSWKPPEDDGGCEVVSYIVEYYRFGWNVWLKSLAVRQNNAILDGLIRGSRYKFRIKAENPYGISKPSSETDVVFIPDYDRGICHPNDTTCDKYLNAFLDSKDSEKSYVDSASDNSDYQTRSAARSKICSHFEDNSKFLSISRDFGKNVSPTPSAISISSHSIPLRDTSPESSEIMLLLHPSNVNTFRSEIISFSAPELGKESELFSPLHHLRNCISSTQLLHTSTNARLYEEITRESETAKKSNSVVCGDDRVLYENDPIAEKYEFVKIRKNADNSSDLGSSSSDFVVVTSSDFKISDKQSENPKMKRSFWDSKRKPIIKVEESIDSSPDSSNIVATSSDSHSTDSVLENNRWNKRGSVLLRDRTDIFEGDIANKISLDRAGFNKNISNLFSRNKAVIYDENLSNDERMSSSLEEIIEESESSEEDYIGCRMGDYASHSSDRTGQKRENKNFPNEVTYEKPLSFEDAIVISNPMKYRKSMKERSSPFDRRRSFRSISPTDNSFLEYCGEVSSSEESTNSSISANPPPIFKVVSPASPTSDRILKPILKPYQKSTETLSLNRDSIDNVSTCSTKLLKSIMKKKVSIEEPAKNNEELSVAQGAIDSDLQRSVINHYSDIVKEYGGKSPKPARKVYLTYEELKAAAEASQVNIPDDYESSEELEEMIHDPSEIVNEENIFSEERKLRIRFILDILLNAVILSTALWFYFYNDKILSIPFFLLIALKLITSSRNKFINNLFSKCENSYISRMFHWLISDEVEKTGNTETTG